MKFMFLGVLILSFITSSAFAECIYDVENIRSLLNSMGKIKTAHGTETQNYVNNREYNDSYSRTYLFKKKKNLSWVIITGDFDDVCHPGDTCLPPTETDCPDCFSNYLYKIRKGCLTVDNQEVTVLKATRSTLSFKTKHWAPNPPTESGQNEIITLSLGKDKKVRRTEKHFINDELWDTTKFIGK